jgi:hypothetical protein
MLTAMADIPAVTSDEAPDAIVVALRRRSLAIVALATLVALTVWFSTNALGTLALLTLRRRPEAVLLAGGNR